MIYSYSKLVIRLLDMNCNIGKKLLSERFYLKCRLWLMAAILISGLGMTSCSNDDDDVVVPTPEEQVVLNCAKPDYLKAGDRVAMISPSYNTPIETIEKAADVLRSWGFEPMLHDL